MSTSKRPAPLVGLSLMIEDAYAAASLPLFEAGEVEVLEWSFDIGWGAPIPSWAHDLLAFYSDQNCLLGHGVTFSALSASWSERQADWLQRLRQECVERSYTHISEHFGFSSAGSFHDSAPLPTPRTPSALRIGRDRLARLSDAAQLPIGLENLAFAFGTDDVRGQGDFLEELLAPTDGFLLLDLHNVYCQSCNFGCDARELMQSYPLHRVRELHVSGGSWSESQAQPDAGLIRRDTHDESVPNELFAMVEMALEMCPGVQAVIFERLGSTLQPQDCESFQADFRRLRSAVNPNATST